MSARVNPTWVDPTSVYGIPRENLSPGSLVGAGSVILFPELVVMRGVGRIDSQSYISVGLEMGDRTVVCPGAKVIGGAGRKVVMGEFSYIGWNSLVMARSEDYSHLVGVGFGAPGPAIEGDVIFEPFSGVSSLCSVHPGVRFPEGAVVGLHSMVYRSEDLRPWWIHIGVPARPWKPRADRDTILREAEEARRA